MMSISIHLNFAPRSGRACASTRTTRYDAIQGRGISLGPSPPRDCFSAECHRHSGFLHRSNMPVQMSVATVIAEDVPESKRLLRHVAKWLVNPGYSIFRNPDIRLVHPVEKPLLNEDEFRTRKVSRIRCRIHSVEKPDEPLLQIADACAFGFRRFFSGQVYGQDFAASILGSAQDVKKYPIDQWGGGIFSWADGPSVKVSYAFGCWRGGSSERALPKHLVIPGDLLGRFDKSLRLLGVVGFHRLARHLRPRRSPITCRKQYLKHGARGTMVRRRQTALGRPRSGPTNNRRPSGLGS